MIYVYRPRNHVSGIMAMVLFIYWVCLVYKQYKTTICTMNTKAYVENNYTWSQVCNNKYPWIELTSPPIAGIQ